MTGDVTIGLAFVAGIISFISPCVLPLVPAYVGYKGGRMTQQVATLALAQDNGAFPLHARPARGRRRLTGGTA